MRNGTYGPIGITVIISSVGLVLPGNSAPAFGQGSSVFSESFSRTSANLPEDYPYLSLVMEGASAEVSLGILRIVGGDSGAVYANAIDVVGAETFGDHVIAATSMGAEEVTPGMTGVTLVVGNIEGLLHPGYPGGAFRFQTVSGTHLCNNQDIGFTPAPGVLYDITIEARKLGSVYEFTSTIAGGAFTYTQEIAESYVQGLDKVGVRRGHGGRGLFDYMSITGLDGPCTGPRVLLSPSSQTTPAGSAAAVFSLVASGSPPLSYRWRKNGSDLTDGGRISGATTATLTIDPVQVSDAGQYDVVVTNECGSATSDPATLTVLGPPKVHALLIGCEEFRNALGHTWTYHGMKDANALGAALRSLGNVDNIDTLEITPSSATPKSDILGRIAKYMDPNSPNFLPAGETLLLFIGSHGENGRLALHIDPSTGNWSGEEQTCLRQSELRDALRTNPNATKVVILPGCHTASFWPAPGLESVPKTCLFAGAAAEEVSHFLPDPFVPPGLPTPWYLSDNLAGMTPLTVTLVMGLMRTPWTTSPADTNFDGVVSFAELRWWVLAANYHPLFLISGSSFDAWGTFGNSDWPILDGLGDLQPFSYTPAASAPDGFDDAPLAASTSTPGDFDSDGDVDLLDFAALQACAGNVADGSACIKADFDVSGTVDAVDFSGFAGCFAGPEVTSACLPPGCGTPVQDTDRDGRVDLAEFARFQACFAGPIWPWPEEAEQQTCICLDQDNDRDVDLADFAILQIVFAGDLP